MSVVPPPATPQLTRRLTVFGHSYAEGTGATKPSHRWSTRLAAMLGADEENFGVGGTSVVLQSNGPDANLVSETWRLPVVRVSDPEHGAPVQIAAIYHGINDLGLSQMYSDNADLFISSVRAAINRLRNGGMDTWNDSASALTFQTASGGGAWSNDTSSKSNFPSGGAKFSTNNGNTWTVTLPATFPGGKIRVYGAISGSGFGAVHSITVDGSAVPGIDTRNVVTLSYWRPWCWTSPTLSAGAHTIVGTLSSIATLERVTHVEVEAPNPPVVLVASLNRSTTYPSSTHTITDADVATFNGYLRSLCAEYTDGRVIYVDTDTPLGKSSAYFSGGAADGIHPNSAGHALIAETMYNALPQGLIPKPTQVRAFGRHVRQQHSMYEPSDGMSKPISGVVTLVAGAGTFTSRAITANTRVGGCTPIGDPTGGTAGFVSPVAITASSGITAGTITIKSSNAGDTRPVHIWIYEAAT